MRVAGISRRSIAISKKEGDLLGKRP